MNSEILVGSLQLVIVVLIFISMALSAIVRNERIRVKELREELGQAKGRWDCEKEDIKKRNEIFLSYQKLSTIRSMTGVNFFDPDVLQIEQVGPGIIWKAGTELPSGGGYHR